MDNLEKILEINNLLKEKSPDEIEAILSLLRWDFSKEALDVLENNKFDSQEKTKEEKIQDYLKKAKKARHDYPFLRPLVNEKSTKARDLYKTFWSIWVNKPSNSSSLDLEDNEYGYERHFDNHLTNYKIWLWKKLFLSKDFIDEKSVEDIDNIALHYLDRAINHVNIFYSNFTPETRTLLKSQYFEQIHNWEGKKTIFGLIKFFKQLKNREYILKREFQNNKRGWINYENVFKELNIAFWEIQRILALCLLYIDREKNQNYQHTPEDIDYIVKKLEKVTSNTILNDWTINPESPLYHITNSWNYYWNKNQDWIYEINEENIEGSRLVKLESFDFVGRIRPYEKTKSKVSAYHILSRMKKLPYSSVDKVIRKNLTTFNQIMDNKWFMIVVKNFEEWKKLIKILENEIWTWETSYIEEVVFMNKDWNKNTNSHYNCLKATMKIPYKGKLIKQFFEMLEQHFKSNAWLMMKIRELKKACEEKNWDSIDYKQVEKLIWDEISNSKLLRETYTNLKNKFRKKEYNIEIEIQIFDIQNYFKAEVDEESPAYHGHYKKRQVLDALMYNCPIWIYPEESIKTAAWELIN